MAIAHQLRARAVPKVIESKDDDEQRMDSGVPPSPESSSGEADHKEDELPSVPTWAHPPARLTFPHFWIYRTHTHTLTPRALGERRHALDTKLVDFHVATLLQRDDDVGP
jgi:hypothetical protein